MNRRTSIFTDLPPMPRILPRWSHATVMILGLALVVRLGAGVALKEKLAADPDAYAKLAENLHEFGVYGSAGYVPADPEGDPDAKPRLVTRPTAYRPPLYPVLLRYLAISKGEVSATRVLLLHVVFGVVTTLIVWQISLRSHLGAWSMVAVMVTLFDPILINQSALVMTETLATMLAAAALWALLARKRYLRRKYGGEERSAAQNAVEDAEDVEDTEDTEDADGQGTEAAKGSRGSEAADALDASDAGRRARPRRLSHHRRFMQRLERLWLPWLRFDILAGTLLGLAILCRPTFLAWLGLLVIVEIVRNLYHDRFGALRHTIAMSCVVALVLTPWAMRNSRVMGKLTPTTTHGGYTLLLGNNPDFYRFLRESPPGSTWDASKLDADRLEFIRRNKLTEVEADQDSYGRALEAISKDPRAFAYSCYVRLGRFWSPMPHKGTVGWSAKGSAKGAPNAADQPKPDQPKPDQPKPDDDSRQEDLAAESDDPTSGDSAAESPESSDAEGPSQESPRVAVETPTAKAFRWGAGAWYDAVMIFVLVGATVVFRHRPNGPWTEGFLLVIALTVVHTVFWSNMRMRAPLTPFLSLLVAAGLTLVFSREKELVSDGF